MQIEGQSKALQWAVTPLRSMAVGEFRRSAPAGGVSMDVGLDQQHLSFLREAIRLAQEAERRGNLPIGAVIVLDGEIVARGMNAIWSPAVDLTRHAEMEALRAVPSGLWPRSREMTLLTTLEPCVMCAGAILLHGIGRLAFGSRDPSGGVGETLASLPPYFREQLSLVHWIGPVLSAECDPFYTRVQELERLRSTASSTISAGIC
jgi:tRNA(adenine34) deaminase